MQPLAGHLVVDFTRQLPGPYASRELMRLGARVVKVEPPEGDPMQHGAPAWYDAVNAGKEIVTWDAASGSPVAQELCDEADVILDGFRPGVFERLGLVIPDTAVVCAITGFGDEGRHAEARGPRPQLHGLGRRARRHGARRCLPCRRPTWPQARSEPSPRSSPRCSSAAAPDAAGASRSR